MEARHFSLRLRSTLLFNKDIDSTAAIISDANYLLDAIFQLIHESNNAIYATIDQSTSEISPTSPRLFRQTNDTSRTSDRQPA